MAASSAARLIAAWNPAGSGSAHRRLRALLEAVEGRDAVRDDTLGGRNRRLLALHRRLVERPLEARVECAQCNGENEFLIPIDAILAAPAPDPDTRVRLRAGGRTFTFRVPRMSDIEAVSAVDGGDVRNEVLTRCRIGSDGSPVPETIAGQLGQRFEVLDPAANIVVRIACSSCGWPIAASVDVASFVARDLDRLVGSLFRQIDTIASAYGWGELAILALPAGRRRQYVALIAAHGPARSVTAGRAS